MSSILAPGSRAFLLHDLDPGPYDGKTNADHQENRDPVCRSPGDDGFIHSVPFPVNSTRVLSDVQVLSGCNFKFSERYEDCKIKSKLESRSCFR